MDNLTLMDSWERIQLIMDREGLNKNSFSEAIGASNNVTITRLINEKRKASPATCKKIVARFPHYDYKWLLTGEGDMLKSKEDNLQIPNDGTYRLVPVVNSDAVGGMHKLNDIGVNDPEYIKGYIPFTDALEEDLCIPITSDSMIPTCPPGCVVQIRRVENWKEYFGYGNLFVIQLKDGRRIIKEVTKYEPDPKDYILCVSHNKSVPAEELPKDFIVSVWKVIKVLTDRGW